MNRSLLLKMIYIYIYEQIESNLDSIMYINISKLFLHNMKSSNHGN